MNQDNNKHKKTTQGKVVSTKMDKTVVVDVISIFRHPLYKKTVKKTKKYIVDSNNIDVKVGDFVELVETRPISKNKHHKLVKIVER